MEETLKAGCYLVNTTTKKIALVYREHLNDFSFPKGHLEANETLKECAVRETAEETKRVAKIVEKFEPVIECYTTPRGEHCKCYMYIAVDNGKSDNISTDTHETLWINFDEVENKLTYERTKASWNSIKNQVESLFD